MSTVRAVPPEEVLGEEGGMKGRCAINLHSADTVSQRRLGKAREAAQSAGDE
jgi:hypothetical protein